MLSPLLLKEGEKKEVVVGLLHWLLSRRLLCRGVVILLVSRLLLWELVNANLPDLDLLDGRC